MKTYLFSFFLIVLFSFSNKTIAQDTLINFDDVEFTDGNTELVDTTDIVFSDGEPLDSAEQVSTQVDSLHTNLPASDDAKTEDSSLWSIFITGVLGGFAAFFMPCIFPMVPLTVSFFTKKAGSRSKAISQAFMYGLFIIVIYVALGML